MAVLLVFKCSALASRAAHRISLESASSPVDTKRSIRNCNVTNELNGFGLPHRGAIICAEALCWRRHRGMVADYLFQCGWNVNHRMRMDRIAGE